MVKFSKRSRSYIIEVHNGSLIGTDRGEWGGELYWESNSGTSKYKIVNGNFKKFIKHNAKIFAIEGLAHLTQRRGKLIKIYFKDKWKAEVVIDLKDAPHVSTLPLNNFIYVVTSKKFLKINLDDITLTELHTNMFWWGMYPNSIVMVNPNIIYIGMRGGIIKVNLEKNTIHWMTKKMG